MRIGFFGTPQIAAYCLETLADAHDIAFIVTNEDKPCGRNLHVRCCPAKEVALERGIRFHHPPSLKDPAFLDALTAEAAELFVVVAFGRLIPRTVWERAGGYDERLSLNNDFHFSIALLLAANGVQFAERAIYSYRKTGSGALSGSSGRKAMESALLTTQLGTDMLLQRDSSATVRRICANRFQQWLFQFYPAFPDLAETASGRINELGGSDLQLQGGRILRMLLPVIGWKRVRQIQNWVYSRGWQHALRRKQAKRLAALK